jgi:serine/threonine protein phosphatase PrpC
MISFVYTSSPHIPGYAYRIKRNIFAVADGVSRIKTIDEKPCWVYDRLVKVPADIFCQKAVDLMIPIENPNKTSFLNAFRVANEAIDKKNEEFGFKDDKDYFLHYLSTTAVLGYIKDQKLALARICDCGAAILRNESIFFKTPDYNIQKYDGKFGEMPEGFDGIRFFRRYIRNNSTLPKKMSDGVLTGQPSALRFIDFYRRMLKPKDVVLLYSDGFEPYFNFEEFLRIFFEQGFEKAKRGLRKFSEKKAIENSEKFGRERTLVAIKV